MKIQRILLSLSLLAAAAGAADKTVAPTALPTGGNVAAGQATIREAGARMDIDQSSQRVVLDWRSFDIGSQAHVNFNQPSSSSLALNRVLSNDPSAIYGRLTANGQVFFSNPSGVLFAPGAQVDVGGIAATTLDIGVADFMAGRYAFSGNGGSATVVNRGTINAAVGGYVALFGPRVSNEGVIVARLGKVVLGAGDAVLLDFAGNGLLNFRIDRGAIAALVENKGLIQAPGGEVLMTAKTASQLMATVVNNQGVIEAQTLDNKPGRILLLGDMERGETRVGGTLDASAPNGGDGGFIETSAAKVKVLPGFKVSTLAVRGKTGLWLIDPNDFHIGGASSDYIGGGAALSGALLLSNVTIESTTGANAGGGDIFVFDPITLTNTLTLKAERDVVVMPGLALASGGAAANLVLWAASSPNAADGVVGIGLASTITTGGGHVWIGGGSGSSVWNGLAVGDGYAKAGRGMAAVIVDGTINAGAGNVLIKGQADYGSQAVSRTGTISGSTVTVQERFVLPASTATAVTTAVPVLPVPFVAPPAPPANAPSVLPTLLAAADGGTTVIGTAASGGSAATAGSTPQGGGTKVLGAVTGGRVNVVGAHPMFGQPLVPGQVRVTLLPGSGEVVILGPEATVVLDKPLASAQTADGGSGEIAHGETTGNAVQKLAGAAVNALKGLRASSSVRDAVTAGRVVNVGQHPMFAQPIAPGQVRVTLMPGRSGDAGAVVILGPEATVVLDKPLAAAQTAGGGNGEIAFGATDNNAANRLIGGPRGVLDQLHGAQ